MITCLTDQIGLLYVSDYPKSGKYINDIPGITTEHLQNIREESETYDDSEAWRVLYDRANNAFEWDLLVKMRKYFKRSTVVDTTTTAYVKSSDTIGREATKIGWLFDMWDKSPNLKINFNSVQLNLASAQDVTVYIYDATTGKELYSQTFTGVSGFNEFFIGQSYSFRDYRYLFVAYGGEIDAYKMQVLGVAGAYTKKGNHPTRLGAAVDIGMSVTYNVKCSVDNFICQRLELFLEPFLYKLAVMFFEESRNSARINRWTLLDTENQMQRHAELKDAYEEKLSGLLSAMEVPQDDHCFHCNKASIRKIMIP
jgi:hypothetical protein